MNLDHVPLSDLGPIHEQCPACDADTGQAERELLLQEGPQVWLLRCLHCGASYAERFPSQDFLSKLYDPSHYSSPLTSERALSDRCAQRILECFSVAPQRALEIVDYGGNRGTLAEALYEALRKGGHTGPIQATVVDLFPGPARGAVRFISPETFAQETRCYDLVVASAVLEHLPNMRSVIHRLLETASPDALFYARTPFDVPLAKMNLGYSLRWPRHLFDLGNEFWDRFPTTYGASGELLASRPSLTETSLTKAPLRSALAHLLKAPENCRQRLPLSLRNRLPVWPYVGGWEVLLQLDTPS